MEDAPIRLRPGRPPSTMRVLAWLLGLNVLFVMVSVVILGGVMQTAGTDWMEDGTNLVLVLGTFIVVIAAAFVAVFLFARRGARVTATMRVGDDDVRIVSLTDEVLHESPMNEFAARAAQLYEMSDGQPYPVGPAIEMTFGEAKVVVANRTIRGRWEGDVPTAREVAYSCEGDDWERLLEALDIGDAIVPY